MGKSIEMPADRHSPPLVFDGCPARAIFSAFRYASSRFLARSNLVFSHTRHRLLGNRAFCRFETQYSTSWKIHHPEWFLFRKGTLERRDITMELSHARPVTKDVPRVPGKPGALPGIDAIGLV